MTAIRRFLKWMLLLCVSLTGVCFSGLAAASDGAEADRGDAPSAVQEAVHDKTQDAGRVWTVLVPEGPEAAASRAIELFEELSLVSMGTRVRAVKVPPNLLTDGKENRGRLITEMKGEAVLWLSMDAPEVLFVLTIAAEPVGHMLHRIEADTAASLALAARDLLERPLSANDIALPAVASHKQLDDIEIPWRQKPPLPPPPPPYREDFGMALMVQGGTGFFGGNGADFWTVGTGLFFQWMPKRITVFRLFVSGGIGPTYATDEESVFGKWIEPGIAAVVSRRQRKVHFGPVFSFSGVFTSLKLTYFDAAALPQVVNNWNLKGGFGLALSIPVREGCRVGLDTGVEALLFRYHYQEARTQQDVIVSPTLTWKTLFTAVFFFPNKRR